MKASTPSTVGGGLRQKAKNAGLSLQGALRARVSALVPLGARLHRGLRAEAEGEGVGLSSSRLWLTAEG